MVERTEKAETVKELRCLEDKRGTGTDMREETDVRWIETGEI
jgi:hypothetical protein